MDINPEYSAGGALAACQSVLQGSAVTITRLNYDGHDLPPRAVNKRIDAFNVITQLVDFSHHRLWRGENLVHDGGHKRGTLAITDLRDEWRCHHLSPFDNVRFQIPFSYIRQFAFEVGRPEFTHIRCQPGTRDDVILGLAQALLPAFHNPKTASQLFLEQIVLAMMTHLAQNYGGLHFPSHRKGTLAPWQEKRATEFLSAHVNSQVSIDEVAEACNLSRSYFIKAFKETFGKPPYRWLIEYRVARAKDFLASDMPIAEIATACGFADQSHMTRIFSEVVGEPPGHWRKHSR
ncbi:MULTISPECIES: helix-turn-helix domain-containing protein [Rhizobium]|uniref:AraC family transcriptional regulator n=1 Tax=Rhizobium favelukesii TaxID=348824 RepID=W6RV77_9HYPH|nr:MULTISPECIES: AraC family transcriptional regulator [Rhizobium]MCA0805606.1 AraC family transcriptional regulator [Rhizobium sp. T1473]MCS0459233.1 AraC family transcriptional regulator [Rhizobium favelukesii]UFS79054.1 AraC family transcriptional regulator [Rhizobium sp. T136]CDM62548.1 AraC family transcriptional regulator [Rhizobium favelukesii]